MVIAVVSFLCVSKNVLRTPDFFRVIIAQPKNIVYPEDEHAGFALLDVFCVKAYNYSV
jgi:hypothetical protein